MLFQAGQLSLTCGFHYKHYKKDKSKKHSIFHSGAGEAENRILTKCCKTHFCNLIVPPIPKQNVTNRKDSIISFLS